jgi:protein-L-isoaspartate(D-aspartate) O-methyltransferase
MEAVGPFIPLLVQIMGEWRSLMVTLDDLSPSNGDQAAMRFIRNSSTSLAVRFLALFCALALASSGCAAISGDAQKTTGTSPAFTSVAEGQTEAAGAPADQQGFEHDRQRMVAHTIVNRGVSDEKVLEAMRTVPRHEFVPEQFVSQAYDDHPLPIGYGQTISQPYIVAWMTELLELQPGEKVLEIGTGSGYQAAVLAELGDIEVYTIEIVPELAESAQARLESLGYGDIHVRQGDGYYGWPEQAPFDAIIVTAAPDHLPPPLADQLRDGGRLVIPIGPPGGYQTLWKFVKQGEDLQANNLGGVAFVPFTGGGIEEAPSESIPTP